MVLSALKGHPVHEKNIKSCKHPVEPQDHHLIGCPLPSTQPFIIPLPKHHITTQPFSTYNQDAIPNLPHNPTHCHDSLRATPTSPCAKHYHMDNKCDLLPRRKQYRPLWLRSRGRVHWQHHLRRVDSTLHLRLLDPARCRQRLRICSLVLGYVTRFITDVGYVFAAWWRSGVYHNGCVGWREV